MSEAAVSLSGCDGRRWPGPGAVTDRLVPR
jgi:hypothetical protein